MNNAFMMAMLNQLTPEQMRGMLAELMQQPDPNPIAQAQPEAKLTSLSASSDTFAALPSNDELAALQSQIKDLQSQLAATQAELNATKLELAAEKQTHEATKAALKYNREHESASVGELANLQKTVRQAEAYLGQSIEEVAQQGRNLSGDDYYGDKKKEWDEEGLTNQEKHDRVKEFRDLFDDDDGLIEF